jgi:hypothetical protein
MDALKTFRHPTGQDLVRDMVGVFGEKTPQAVTANQTTGGWL